MLQRKLVYNTALLTGSSLLMSCIGMAFQVWLVGRIGSAGIGLYQLTISVTNLSATFAISGIRFASTRLVSEELGYENPAGIQGAIKRFGQHRGPMAHGSKYHRHAGSLGSSPSPGSSVSTTAENLSVSTFPISSALLFEIGRASCRERV